MKTPIERMFDRVEWNEIQHAEGVIQEGDAYATHEGVLDIGGFKFKVYILNDGRRIIDQGDMEEFFR